MRRDYLGDSYDLVKRFWAESLTSVAPLLAHPRFVPSEIRIEYSAITGTPMLDSQGAQDTLFGLLIDPHTGVPLPGEASVAVSASHAPLPFIIDEIKRLHPSYVMCFDQSHHRRHQLSIVGQRQSKCDFLAEHGIESFYYVSHAAFLFMANDGITLNAIRRRLLSCGIPRCRLEPDQEVTQD